MSTISSGYLVGVAVILVDEHNRVLLGLRASEQRWASFGGRLEAGESAHAGARREVQEELGIELGDLTPLFFGEGTKSDGTHYVTLYFLSQLLPGQTPVVQEPHLAEKLNWFDINSLPTNIWARERALILRTLDTSFLDF